MLIDEDRELGRRGSQEIMCYQAVTTLTCFGGHHEMCLRTSEMTQFIKDAFCLIPFCRGQFASELDLSLILGPAWKREPTPIFYLLISTHTPWYM